MHAQYYVVLIVYIIPFQLWFLFLWVLREHRLLFMTREGLPHNPLVWLANLFQMASIQNPIQMITLAHKKHGRISEFITRMIECKITG